MKKPLPAHLLLLCFFGQSLFLTGCIKDEVKTTLRYTIYTPSYKTVKELRENMATLASRDVAYPGKIYIKGAYLFVGERNRGIHIIDNSNPAAPKNTGFLEIPYNADMAVKNQTLYADMGGDLLSLDITDPKNAKLKTVTEKVFQFSLWKTEDDKVVVDWSKRDTVVHSKSEARSKNGDVWYPYFNEQAGPSGPAGASGPPAVYGTGGSMARFAATKERLFTVGQNNMGVFNITNDFNPAFVTRKDLGWGIETIFPFGDHLFVGTISGVKVFSLTDPDNPGEIGSFGHVRRCDPVVTDGKHMFVTLRGGGSCGGNASELQILTATSLTAPQLIKSYTLDNPFGLAVDGNTLLICDGNSGLKVYDIANVNAIKLLQEIKGVVPYDVIASNGLAVVSAADGIYQYNYKNPASLKLLSSIKLKK